MVNGVPFGLDSKNDKKEKEEFIHSSIKILKLVGGKRWQENHQNVMKQF